MFWAYLMWAQFLVIWYGNLPEETGFVFARLWGHWLPIGRAVLLGMFVIPFIGLLGVAPKKFPATLGLFTAVSLVALWLERYLLVVPSVTTAAPMFGLPELGPTLAFLGLFLVAYALYARNFPMLSPRLALITLERERGHGHGHEFEHDETSRTTRCRRSWSGATDQERSKATGAGRSREEPIGAGGVTDLPAPIGSFGLLSAPEKEGTPTFARRGPS